MNLGCQLLLDAKNVAFVQDSASNLPVSCSSSCCWLQVVCRLLFVGCCCVWLLLLLLLVVLVLLLVLVQCWCSAGAAGAVAGAVAGDGAGDGDVVMW